MTTRLIDGKSTTTIQFSVNGHEFTVEQGIDGGLFLCHDNDLRGGFCDSLEAQQAAINYAKGLTNDANA